jgi:FAD synthase
MQRPWCEEFVLTLKDIGVGGVVAGRNYRFGFKAAGNTVLLQELGQKHGVEVSIVDLLPVEEEEELQEEAARGRALPNSFQLTVNSDQGPVK